jgi:hypothetical protein
MLVLFVVVSRVEISAGRFTRDKAACVLCLVSREMLYVNVSAIARSCTHVLSLVFPRTHLHSIRILVDSSTRTTCRM